MPDTIIVISDATCLISLTNIEELHLLKQVYGEVVTTPEVANEYGLALPDWIKTASPQDLKFQRFMETILDEGESSAIALAVEINNALLILDESKARQFAHNLGLTYTGTLGVILKAKTKGYITEIKPLVEKLKAVNFRLSEKVELAILKQAGE